MVPLKCPCGRPSAFSACCKPYLDGTAVAAHPELLMRSRYTAFVQGDFAYLRKTWHPDTVPELSGDDPSNWVGLEILETSLDAEGERGKVEFVARLIVGDHLAILHEVSDFEKIDGRWVYRSGEFKSRGEPAQKIAMKAPCPCGSGEKFKRCHFARVAVVGRGGGAVVTPY